MDLRLLPEAMRISRRAVREFDGHGVPLMAAEAQWRLARLALLMGHLDDDVIRKLVRGNAIRMLSLDL